MFNVKKNGGWGIVTKRDRPPQCMIRAMGCCKGVGNAVGLLYDIFNEE